MVIWQYFVLDHPPAIIDALQAAGLDGWELVAIVEGVFYFKRPKQW